MKYEYIKARKRLNVFGTDCDRDIQTIKKYIEEKKVPRDIENIVYRESAESKFSAIFRGAFLAEILAPEDPEQTPRVIRPKIRTILRAINDNNQFEHLYAGVTFYSTATKRFMFAMPRGKHNSAILLGDHPVRDNETAVEIVCRVTEEDTKFEVDPKWLLPLATIEMDGCSYHSFLVLVEREFKPAVSPRLLNVFWASIEEFKGLRLHHSVHELFKTDEHLKKLTSQDPDIDFEAILEEILAEQRKQ